MCRECYGIRLNGGAKLPKYLVYFVIFYFFDNLYFLLLKTILQIERWHSFHSLMQLVELSWHYSYTRNGLNGTMPWKQYNNKTQIENLTNALGTNIRMAPRFFPRFSQALSGSPQSLSLVLLRSFSGHLTAPIFSVFLCHPPLRQGQTSLSKHLPPFISFPKSSLHPAAVSLPRWALCPGRINVSTNA